MNLRDCRENVKLSRCDFLKKLRSLKFGKEFLSMDTNFLQQQNPWPELRKKRIKKLLPLAMQLAKVDVWVILCRENANDPLAKHVGGENAGRTAAIIFQLKGDEIESTIISPWGEIIQFQELALYDHIIKLEQNLSIYDALTVELDKREIGRLAFNYSTEAIADGLSAYQLAQIKKALSASLLEKITSAEEIIFQWLSVKLPQEVEIMAKSGALTVQLQLEAYQQVIPNKTRDCDVADFIKQRVKELGVGFAWPEGHNPNVNSGFPRGHAGPSEKVIVPGDIIQTDFGIKVFDMWCTDYQRFAYVLFPGQKCPSQEIQSRWKNAVLGQRVAFKALQVDSRGYDVDLAQRLWMEKSGSLPVKWGTGHSVGYWAHDIGPALSGAQHENPPPTSLKKLREGQTFAFDGFFAWHEKCSYGEGEKLISVEEMAVITAKGGKYLIPPQEELILIPTR